MSRPDAPIGVSLGDPAGIGPEIIAKAWQALRYIGPAFSVLGDADVLSRTGVPVARLTDLAEAGSAFRDALPVFHDPVMASVTPGKPDPAHAAAILRWIETGVSRCLDGALSALVTAPIAKAPLYAAGFRFPGHTEFLAELCREAPMPGNAKAPGQRDPVMMLMARDLRVSLATIHIPLKDVPERLTAEGLEQTIRVTHDALIRDFGIAHPRLALAGLNPHAGEDGTIGREEVELLIPLAQRLRDAGLDLSDPKPADTLFHDEARQRYDAVIGLYHDQALIPVKTLDFWGGVNVTLGLPIVRTSPDHGTGFDIAGQGIARPDSLIAALRAAADLSAHRRAAIASL
ncbi:MAG: 4-hydroxythreonine-4-phosphate dehydrogenase PdxA [Asticcacaulis sp.]